jgi:signal transduction histidine kinase
MSELLTGASPRVYDRAFPEGAGRWEVRRTTFRQDGRPHVLLVIADVTKSLREEELLAWQRLVRVLSHEINNSLAPIKSLAGTLQIMVARQSEAGGGTAVDVTDDMRHGLGIIESRADSLSRFMSSYARLARLPAPRRAPVALAPLVHRVAALERRLTVRVEAGEELTLVADSDQVEQALINLIRNAADASLETGGSVRVSWRTEGGTACIEVRDEGKGLSGTTNLFVPFFTTKPEGTGIGLVLARQVAEGHGGSVTLENRDDGVGCVARLRLPLLA